jgi:poly-beta-hydroxyalkanoate depolymerase
LDAHSGTGSEAGDETHLRAPSNPLAGTAYARTIAAACQLFETTTRPYDQPAFRLATTLLDGQQVDVSESVWERPLRPGDRVRSEAQAASGAIEAPSGR